MVINYYRSMMWCRINRSMIEYVAGSSDLQRNVELLICHSVVTNCGVLHHLWSMKPTWAWENETLIRHIPPVFVICSNSDTRILDRCSPSYPGMSAKVIDMIWDDISRNRTRTMSGKKFSMRRDIIQKLCMYDLATSFNKRPVSPAATSDAFYWAFCLTILFSSGSTLQSRIVTEATMLPACQFLMSIAWAYSNQGNSPIDCIQTSYLHYQLLGGWSPGITHNAAIT